MNGAPWGGSEELWYRTALWLAKKGGKVGCAVYDWKEKKERMVKLQKAGCTVFLLPNPKQEKDRGVKKLLSKFQQKAKLKTAIANLPVEEYNTVVVNQGGFEIYTPTWKVFYRRLKNYALLFHNYNEEQDFSSSQKQALKQWMQNASVNLFAARRIQTVLQEKLNNEISNASVFINPITFHPPGAITPYPALINGQYRFAMLAALDVARKAQDKLIGVLSSGKWKARAWQLHLYGEGRDKTMLKKLVAELGLQQKIFLHGHVADAATALQQAHLILQITNVDAMPLTVMEAMAMARPVVVSRIGDMPLWIDSETGWVCNTNIEAIDACLEEAWQAKEQWKAMGEKSFALFRQKYPAQPEERFLAQILS